MGTKKRKRREFAAEFKAETVRLVRDSDKSVTAIARELDLTETALRRWVQQAEVDAGREPDRILGAQGECRERASPRVDPVGSSLGVSRRMCRTSSTAT
jgi:transposase-like protein